MRRDFTFIEDVIETVARLIEAPRAPQASDQAQSVQAPYRIYNVGNGQPVEVIGLVDVLENIIGKKAKRELLPMRPIDVLETFADGSELERVTGFTPHTAIEDGMRSFVSWFRDFSGRA